MGLGAMLVNQLFLGPWACTPFARQLKLAEAVFISFPLSFPFLSLSLGNHAVQPVFKLFLGNISGYTWLPEVTFFSSNTDGFAGSKKINAMLTSR